jgi:hypothetical protein
MPFYDKMMLRKRYIIETINDLLKKTAESFLTLHLLHEDFVSATIQDI